MKRASRLSNGSRDKLSTQKGASTRESVPEKELAASTSQAREGIHGVAEHCCPAYKAESRENDKGLCSSKRFAWRIDEYKVQQRGYRTAKTRVILRDIVGEAQSGWFVAILGPSGAGKTSLLDCLALRTQDFTGCLQLDGAPITEASFFTQTAYVHQQGLFFSNITVREHLTFQAINTLSCRLESRQECLARVDQVIVDVGLEKVADCLIGGGMFSLTKGLSGGERKRLSVATGLLPDPSVILLDEPTSGLDAFMGCHMCLHLSRLCSSSSSSTSAARRCLVMASFHSPSSKMLSMFTHVLLLTPNGRLGYFGPATQLVSFLERVEFRCPANYNPADFALELLASQGCQLAYSTTASPPWPAAAATSSPPPTTTIAGGGEDCCVSAASAGDDGDASKVPLRRMPAVGGGASVMLEEACAKELLESKEGQDLCAALRPDNSHRVMFRTVGGQSSLWTQYCTNVVRVWREVTRDHLCFALVFWLGILFVIFMGVNRYNKVHASLQSSFGYMVSMMVVRMMAVVFPVTLRTPAHFQVILREYYSGSNSAVSYLAARSTVDVPLCFLYVFHAVIPYLMIGLHPKGLGLYCMVVAMHVYASQAVGILASSFSTNIGVTFSLEALFTLVTSIGCGFVVTTEKLTWGLWFLRQISIQHYCLVCEVLNEARHVGGNFEAYAHASLKIKTSDFLFSFERLALLGIACRLLSLVVLMARMRMVSVR